MIQQLFPYATFREIPLKRITPKGHLLQFLQRQKTGLSGNYEKSGYPFNTQMWTGERITPFFKEHEYNGREKEVPSSNSWWPYEQVSYLLDGLLKLGILLDSGKEKELFRKNLDAFLKRKDADGRLGLKNYDLDCEWPFSVFFRAVKCYWENEEDPELFEIFRRHYHVVDEKDYIERDRGVTNIEGMLITALLTGDEALLAKAEKIYLETSLYCEKTQPLDALYWEEIRTKENIVRHGVTLSEELKLPVLLFLSTGKKQYLTCAMDALERILLYHEQPCGLPSSNEYGTGKDPLQGYESCVITDFAWTLGYFLMATGDGKYADRIEKITYNALPGSITKDFTLLQYFSSVNQFISTPFSNHTLFLRQAPLRQYRPDHFAACCPGNIHRAMPNFIGRMWMEAEDSSPVAAFYGPSEAVFDCQGTHVVIREETNYPFEESITFHFQCSQDVDMPFTFRIPQWVSASPEIFCNARQLSLPWEKGSFVKLERVWQNGDTLTLKFPAECRIRKDRQWQWVERGALLYALSIPAKVKKEREEDPFSPIWLTPAGEWDLALDTAYPVTLERKASSYPYEEPAVILHAFGRKITNYFLDQARYTPQIPIFYEVSEKVQEMELVPFGTTLLRALCFPDTLERKMVPVLSAKCSPLQTFDALQGMEKELDRLPENALSSEELFDSIEEYLEMGETPYFDLRKHFGKCENVMATLLVRFYLEEEKDITICAGISDGGILALNDQEIGKVYPPCSGEFTAPLFFPCRGRKGHNYLRIRIVDPPTAEQHLHSWGAKVMVFYV